MRCGRLVQRSLFWSLVVALVAAGPSGLVRQSWGQLNAAAGLGGPAGQQVAGQPGQQGQGSPSAIVVAPQQNNQSGANGVIVDAEGVLHSHVFVDPTQRSAASIGRVPLGQLNRLVDKASKLRKVSLNRLEAVVRANSRSSSR